MMVGGSFDHHYHRRRRRRRMKDDGVVHVHYVEEGEVHNLPLSDGVKQLALLCFASMQGSYACPDGKVFC